MIRAKLVFYQKGEGLGYNRNCRVFAKNGNLGDIDGDPLTALCRFVSFFSVYGIDNKDNDKTGGGGKHVRCAPCVLGGGDDPGYVG